MIKPRIKVTKGSSFVCCLALVLSSLFSCSNIKNEDGSLHVFRYNEHKNIGSLDPAFAKDNADIWAVNQLFNGLVEMDEQLNIKPSIATRWDIDSSATSYTFTLRNDVYFHKHQLFGNDSTRRVTAKDFEYSLNRLTNPKIASPGSWVMQQVDNIEVLNDSMLTIKLKQPFPAFLGLLSMKYCSVVPKEVVEHYGDAFRSHPIGTGPFKFKRWEENIKLVFRKNELYFETDINNQQLPYLEAVAITFLPDKQSEFLQFTQGNLDFLNALDTSYKDDILNADGSLNSRYETTTQMLRGPYLNTEYLAFFLKAEVPEIQSEQLRKAINLGFDRKKMMQYLRNGVGIPANGGFIPKGLPGFNPSAGYSYQPEQAKILVEDFKKTTGIANPSITITTTSNYLDFCEFIQRELLKIGIDVKVDVMPASALKDAKANGKLDLFRASWVADYPDAENYLSLFYSKNFAPNGPNYTHFEDESFDKLYEASLSVANLKERATYYAQMDSLIMKQAPVVVLFYDEVVRFTRKNIEGLGINPINLLDLRQVRKIP
ncbi:ABC transporter substrate-binding protein [Paucihalobacter ruber]|uniref:ABC transporter substrate-binding protein n=1 Tax=Paucihalobacter ruber TaxID=2567861 RepID=A0A506PNP9_9FLAO|nr:ABC transporter substrate-binding protein [Paucihalobacter ruber]TPV33790.1 ABC transporter substrate-binding protein [Paucihalobacter ruber]